MPDGDEFPFFDVRVIGESTYVSAGVWKRLARERLVPHYRLGGRVFFDPAELIDYFCVELNVPTV